MSEDTIDLSNYITLSSSLSRSLSRSFQDLYDYDDYDKCKNNFNIDIQTVNEPGKINSLFDCINIFKKHSKQLDEIRENIHNGKCIYLTNKKEEYYTKTYDPRPIILNFEKELSKTHPLYLKFIEYCDQTITEKCCNCVSVTLYIKNINDFNILSRFLFTIEQR